MLNSDKVSLVSVVIPCYNAAKYISSCLKSIMMQTYSRVEIIVVDDGSTDETADILREFKNKIRYFLIRNGGVSRARNFGIGKANGRFLMFVDADDYLLPTAIQSMVNAANKNRAEIVVSGQYSFVEDPHSPKKVRRIENASIQTRTALFKFLFPYYNTLKVNPPYGRLYRLDLVIKNDLHFPEGLSIGEDFVFNLSYYSCISKAVFINETFYGYRQNVKGLSSRFTGDFWEGKGRMWMLSADYLRAAHVSEALLENELIRLLFSYFSELIRDSGKSNESIYNNVTALIHDERIMNAIIYSHGNVEVQLLKLVLQSGSTNLVMAIAKLISVLK